MTPHHTFPSTPRRTIALLLTAVGLCALAAGGCNGQQKKNLELQIADLQSERDMLRQENEQLGADLRAAQDRAASLEAEAATLRAAPTQASSGYVGGKVITVSGDVLFASGSATIKQSAHAELNRIADELRSRYSGHRIEIAGFTDSDPLRKTKDKWTDNENLSAQRALAVERYLAGRGIPADSMHSAAYGSADPRGTKQASRRVEIRILDR